jgi:hypothetical protein
MRWLSGGLLLLVGAYLTYYWAVVLFGPGSAQNAGPLGVVARFTSAIQDWVNSGGGRWLLLGSAVVVLGAVLAAVWQWVFTSNDTSIEDDAATEHSIATTECHCEPVASSQPGESVSAQQ